MDETDDRYPSARRFFANNAFATCRSVSTSVTVAMGVTVAALSTSVIVAALSTSVSVSTSTC
jgi:hypothetical protein